MLKEIEGVCNERLIEEEKKRMEMEHLKKDVQDAEAAKLASYNQPMSASPPQNNMRPVQDTILAQNQRAMQKILKASGLIRMPFVFTFSSKKPPTFPNLHQMMTDALRPENTLRSLTEIIFESDLRKLTQASKDADVGAMSKHYVRNWLVYYTGTFQEAIKLNLGSTITNNNADDTVYRLLQCTDDPKLQGIIILCCTEFYRATQVSSGQLKFTWIVPTEIPGVLMALQ
jgi:hypothetical protein